MFSRVSRDLIFYFRKQEYKFLINEHNLLSRRWIVIMRLKRLLGYENFNAYIFYLFKEWIDLNFGYTQEFIRKFYRIVRKYNLQLTTQEREFIYNVEEVNFALWRPLKELPMGYEFNTKEKSYFKNNNVNLHTINGKEIKFLAKGDLILTNQSLFLISELNYNQILSRFSYNKITKVEYIGIGVKFCYDQNFYLLRHNNHMLIYALLSRVLNKKLIEFNLTHKPDSLQQIRFIW